MSEPTRSILFLDKMFMSPYRKQPRGVELFNLNLVADLERMGFRQSLPVEASWDDTVSRWIRAGSGTTELLHGNSDTLTGNLALAWKLRKRKFDVLLLGNVANRLVPLLMLLRLVRAAPRCVLIVHREPSRRSLHAQKLWPTTVVAVNGKIAGHFERAGFGSVAVSYGIMQAERFHPAAPPVSKGTVDFCVLGHLDSAWKGADTAMAAFRALAPEVRARARLHLVAYHQPPAIAEKDIAAYPWMDPDALPDLLRKMDVLLVPSRDEEVMRETFSQAMVQGMLTGLPILANDLPVLTEKLDRGGGLIFRNVPELTAGMARLAEDAGLREKLGREARATALARYVWSTAEFASRHLFPGETP